MSEEGNDVMVVLSLLPNKRWLVTDDEFVKFPKIEYRRQLNDLTLPFDYPNKSISQLYDDDELIVGASWNNLHYTPNYLARRYIFEKLYLPYEIDSEHIKVRNAVLLWPRINLQSYTFVADPRRVFVMNNDGKFIIEFQFIDNDTILICEQITSREIFKRQHDQTLNEKIRTRSIALSDFYYMDI